MVSGKVCSRKNNQVRKICSRKKILSRGGFLLGCLLSCLFCAVSNYSKASAINIDVSKGGIYQFNTRGTLKFTDGTYVNSSYNYSGGARAIEYKWGQSSVDMRTPSHVSLGCEGMVGNQFVTGSVINFYIVSTRDITDMLMIQPNSGNNATVLDVEAISASDFPFDVVNGTTPEGGWLLEGGAVTGSVRGYKITVLSLTTSNSIELIFSGLDGAKGSGHLIFFPGSYYTLQNETENISDSINDLKAELQASKQQAHEDAEKQLEETKKGNEQQANRWEEEDNKAEEAINSQQDTGAEGSDEAAKEGLNLFKLILETPAGSCKLPEISAFGFSLGQLDLCTYKPPSWLQQVMGAVVTITLAGASIKCTIRVLETLGRAYGGTR